MSKTAEALGLIVGGLALAVLAGPVGIIVLQGDVAVFNAMVGYGLTTALSGVGLLLRQSPKPVGQPASSITAANGVVPRRVIYGQSQTAGVCTYASFPPSQDLNVVSQFLHCVYTLAAHEISSIDAIAINGTVYNFGTDLIWDSVNGWWDLKAAGSTTPNDCYWQHIFFEVDFGRNLPNQPFPNLAAGDPSWTSACVQQGCAKVHVIFRADTGWPALYESGEIPNVQFLITGKKLVDPRVITAWQPSNGYFEFQWIADNFGRIWVQTNSTGTSGVAASRPNFEGASSFPATLSDNTASWTMQGEFVSGAEECEDGNPQGHIFNNRLVNDAWIPNSSWAQNWIIEAPLGYFQQLQSASGTSGATEPNFSTTLGGTTSDGTLSWVCLGRSPHAINPSNSALCVYDYLQDTDAGLAVPAAEIDVASVIAAANVCEEQAVIIVNADTTVVYENLYSCNGMFDHSSLRGNVLTSLCASMAGWCVAPGDFWHVFAGAYVTPTISIGDADMRGPIKGDFRISKREVANGVKGTYIPAYLPTNPAGAQSMTQIPGTWQSQSFPAYQANGLAGKPDYLNSEDGGQIIWQDVQLDFTTSLWTAQRLAKIELMRLRFQETLTLPCKLTAFQLEGGDTFYFTHSRWNIVEGVYQAIQCSINFSNDSDGTPAVGVDLVARQVDPSIYEFQGPTSSTDYGEYSPFGITGVMTGVE